MVATMAGCNDGDPGLRRPLLPLFLDFNGRPVVIFGGGAVGERKAELFSRHGPVRLFARDISPSLRKLLKDDKRQIEFVRCDLSLGFSRFLEGAFLAVPATSDSDLNRAIEQEARLRGILVNSVDGVGDVVVPSILNKGHITIAISTENPALSKYLRMKLDLLLSENFEEMARLLSEVRRENRALVPIQRDRAKIIWQILEDEEIWRLLSISYDDALSKARSYVRPDERG